MSRYSGRTGRLYMSTSGSTVAKPVASLSKYTIDMSADKIDVTCFEDGNQTQILGWPARKGTFSGFWDDTEDTLFAAAESADGCLIYVYAGTNAASKYWYGPAWVDASLDVDAKGAVSVSGSFTAKGTWGRK